MAGSDVYGDESKVKSRIAVDFSENIVLSLSTHFLEGSFFFFLERRRIIIIIMVFHNTNWMRETNAWWIRKVRWMTWSCAFYIPLYRNTYWDYHSRRVAFGNKMDRRPEEQRVADAKALKGNWGYKPRYAPVFEHSMKREKYAQQSKLDRIEDTPRVRTNVSSSVRVGLKAPKDIRTISLIAREHNRTPGVFDYDYPQDFYSSYPDIDADAYVTIGKDKTRKAEMLH